MIVRLATTVSTMIDAVHLAARGAPHGSAVVAEQQTGGIGRHGHSWHSSGDGLYVSIILRPSGGADGTAPIITVALGLAVQRAVNDLARVTADIRWPNDMMLNEKKLAGILVQSVDNALIAGVGVNVNQTSFPEDLRDVATSLRIETGRAHSKDDLLDRVLAESVRYAALPKAEILRQFELNSSYVRDKAVEVDGKVRGVTAGLDENGFLLLSTPQGLQTIYAGGVRPVSPGA